jgi:uncharacterized membrane protein
MYIADEKVKALDDGLSALEAVILMIVVLMPLQALVFQCGWNWFIVPTFAMPFLGYWQAFGIFGVIRFAQKPFAKTDGVERKYMEEAKGNIFASLMVLGIFAIISAMMQ